MAFIRTNAVVLVITASIAGLALTEFVTPTQAQQQLRPKPLTPSTAHVQMTQDAGRDAYIRQNEGTFEEWGKKIDNFNATAAQRGSEAKRTAQRELDNAWTETKAAWAKLKSASHDGWEDAKSAFESSKKKLERAWNNMQT
jgi:hypothetical protein